MDTLEKNRNISYYLGNANRLHLKKTCLQYQCSQKKLGNKLSNEEVAEWAIKKYKERSEETRHDVEYTFNCATYVQKNVYAIALNDPEPEPEPEPEP